jgi:Flp pilus assembly protein TadD
MSTSVASLAKLLAQSSLDDHDEVLKAANAALKKNKSDTEAHHAKAIALLKLERYEDAVKVFEDRQDLKEKEDARLAYAYALYKTGHAEKAAKVAESPSGRGLRHILAQAVRIAKRDQERRILIEARRTGRRTSSRPPRCTRSYLRSASRMRSTTSRSTQAL